MHLSGSAGWRSRSPSLLLTMLALVCGCSDKANSSGHSGSSSGGGGGSADAGKLTATEAADLINGELGGIYAVDAFTRNTATCETEGPSALAEVMGGNFILEALDWFGTPLAQTCLCGDTVEKCAAYEASVRNRDVVPCGLDAEANTYVSADLLTGQFYGGGTLSGGLCQMAGYQETVFQRSPGDKLHIEVRSHWLDLPPTNGACPQDAGKAAQSAPCNEFVVIDAHRIAPLPP